MRLARVCGNVVSTVKAAGFGRHALLLVVDVPPQAPADDPRNTTRFGPGPEPYVAIDLVGAGIGEIVLVTRGGGARVSEGSHEVPTDAAIVGIVDSVRFGGATTFEKQ
jgi:ethanolamine utilization protein EutN